MPFSRKNLNVIIFLFDVFDNVNLYQQTLHGESSFLMIIYRILVVFVNFSGFAEEREYGLRAQ